jgi:hypothetical protein
MVKTDLVPTGGTYQKTTIVDFLVIAHTNAVQPSVVHYTGTFNDVIINIVQSFLPRLTNQLLSNIDMSTSAYLELIKVNNFSAIVGGIVIIDNNTNNRIV